MDWLLKFEMLLINFSLHSPQPSYESEISTQISKKGILSMKDYLMKMKAVCYTLSAYGRPISKEDQVLFILVGLGLKFEPIIAVLTHSVIHIISIFLVPYF